MTEHSRPTLVLLDLEETLIDDWSTRNYLPRRIDCIRRALDETPDAKMGLMSWAVYHDQDMSVFHQEMKSDLEHMLGRAFDPRWTLSLDQWGHELLVATRKRLPRDELFDIFGKTDVLLALARHHPEWVNQHVVLWDDAFDDMTLHVPGRQTTAQVINVLDAEKQSRQRFKSGT